MADKKITSDGSNDPIDELLSKFVPAALKHSSGQVMFDAGKAVGRKEAMQELRENRQTSLSIWQVVTAASLLVALLSLWSQFAANSTASTDQNGIAQNDIDGGGNGNDHATQAASEDFTPNDQRESEFIPPRNWLFSNNMPTNNRNLIGVGNRMLTPVLAEELYELPLPSAPEPPQNAFQLMQQYNQQNGVY